MLTSIPTRPGWIATLVLAALIGCAGDDHSAAEGDAGAAAQCLDSVAADCTNPAYEPEYDTIFRSLLRPSCGSASQCHAGPADKAGGGLVLSKADDAYDYLIGKTDGRKRVVPGKPQCSLLMQRLDSTDPDYRMPAGAMQLPDEVRCAVRKWIAKGAVR